MKLRIIKINLAFFFLLILFLNQAKAENLNQSWFREVEETIKINDQWKENIDRVQRVLVYFCDKWLEQKHLRPTLETEFRPWKNKEICIIFSNTNKEEIWIKFWLSSATKDTSIVCNLDEKWYNEIWKSLVKNYNESDFSFNLKPNETILKKIILEIPKTQSGNFYWCASIKIKDDLQKAEKWKIFSIEIAKNSYMTFNITWSVYNHQRLDDTKYFIQDNKQLILKIITWIILLRLIISIIEQMKKKKHHKNKKK